MWKLLPAEPSNSPPTSGQKMTSRSSRGSHCRGALPLVAVLTSRSYERLWYSSFCATFRRWSKSNPELMEFWKSHSSHLGSMPAKICQTKCFALLLRASQVSITWSYIIIKADQMSSTKREGTKTQTIRTAVRISQKLLAFVELGKACISEVTSMKLATEARWYRIVWRRNHQCLLAKTTDTDKRHHFNWTNLFYDKSYIVSWWAMTACEGQTC